MIAMFVILGQATSPWWETYLHIRWHRDISTNCDLRYYVRFIIDDSRLHGRVVKGVGHLGHDEAMEEGGREFDPRPGHYRRMNF